MTGDARHDLQESVIGDSSYAFDPSMVISDKGQSGAFDPSPTSILGHPSHAHGAEDVLLVRLAPLEAGFLADYEPGQYLTLRITDSEGHSVTRCYSLVGSPMASTRRAYDIAVRYVGPPPGRPDVPAGRMSAFINRELEVGDTVEVRAPAGDFVIGPRGEASLILVAGGIGITPMLSFLESVAASCEPIRIHLVYANRTAISEAFAERIAELRQAIPGLTVIRCWSRASVSDTDVKIGHAELSDLFVSGISSTAPVYFCGPTAMTTALRLALSEAGHPRGRVFEEIFVAPAADENELPNGPFKVTFVLRQDRDLDAPVRITAGSGGSRNDRNT